jgi:hypothetical protein
MSLLLIDAGIGLALLAGYASLRLLQRQRALTVTLARRPAPPRTAPRDRPRLINLW